MARKKAAPKSFNMAAAIRDVLTENPKLSGTQALEVIQKKHPGQTINKNSYSVAFYNARHKLGIKSRRRRKVVRVAKPGAARKSSGGAINMELLQAARQYLAAAGSPDAAVAAIKRLQALQIG
jgi:hypothetical protein